MSRCLFDVDSKYSGMDPDECPECSKKFKGEDRSASDMTRLNSASKESASKKAEQLLPPLSEEEVTAWLQELLTKRLAREDKARKKEEELAERAASFRAQAEAKKKAREEKNVPCRRCGARTITPGSLRKNTYACTGTSRSLCISRAGAVQARKPKKVRPARSKKK